MFNSMEKIKVWPVLVLLSAALLTNADQGCHRRVCYYTNWSQDRAGDGGFKPEDIDPHLCTHLIFSFASLTNSMLVTSDPRDESSPLPPATRGMYERFTDLKAQNPDLKTMLAVGGYAMGVEGFSKAVATAATRKAFIDQAIKFLRFYNFDGLDIDWEYPAHRGSPAVDKHRFTLLVQELQAAFDLEASTSGHPRLLLSAALASAVDIAANAYEINEVSRALDFINLMTYDFHGSWQANTGHNSPLYPHPDEKGVIAKYNIQGAVQYFISEGAPASKINLGLATYGRTFTLTNASNSGVNAPASGPGVAGDVVGAKGIVSYYEVCQMIQNGSKPSYIQEQAVPYIVKGDQWIGYDDVQSIKNKVDYAASAGLGGVMFWELSLDDFAGKFCGQGDFPLINAARQKCSNHASEMTTTSTHASMTSAPTPTTDAYNMCNTDGFYSDPSDCTHYFMCTDGKVSHIKCPQGLAYNSVTQCCDYISMTRCASTQSSPLPSTHYTSLSPSYVTHTDTFQCDPSDDGFFPNPPVCETYYICTAGKAYLLQCAKDLTFNAVTKFCDYPSNHDCKLATSSLPLSTLETPSPVTHTNQFICDPHNDGFFPNPNECESYFICTAGSGYLLQCAKDLTFNAVTKFCDYPSNHNCKPLSSPVKTTTQVVTQPNTAVTQVTHSDQFQCDPNVDGFFPNPADCESYFICTSGLAYHLHCAEDLTFNAITKFCDFPLNHECKLGSKPSSHSQITTVFTSSSTPQTVTPQNTVHPIPVTHSDKFQCGPNNDGFFPNPNDCESYFICTAGLAYHMHCAKDLTFNAITKFCDFPLNHECKLGSKPLSHLQTTAVFTSASTPQTVTPQNTVHPAIHVTHSDKFQCDPNVDGFFPNPADCDSYFICTSGLAYHLHCAEDLTFNAITKFCDFPLNHGCKLGSKPSSNSQTTTVFTTASTPKPVSPHDTVHPIHVTHSDKFQCNPNNDGFFPNPNDCESYFICTSGFAYHLTCAEDLTFNAITKFCDFPLNHECKLGSKPLSHLQTTAVFTSSSTPQKVSPQNTVHPIPVTHSDKFQCNHNNDGFFPNPNDCESYFICTAGLAYHMHCAKDLTFNAVTKFCDYPLNHDCRLGSKPLSPYTYPPSAPQTYITVTHSDKFQCHPNNDGFFPNPTECDSYVICTAGLAYIVPCAEDLTFNAATKFCDLPSNHGCKPGSAPVSKPTATAQPASTTSPLPILTTHAPNSVQTTSPTAILPASPTTTTVDVTSLCNNQGLSDGFHGDPTSCHHYIRCVNHVTTRVACPTGTSWDPAVHACDLTYVDSCQ